MKDNKWIEVPRFVQIATSCDADGIENMYGLDVAGYVWAFHAASSGEDVSYWYRMTVKARDPESE